MLAAAVDYKNPSRAQYSSCYFFPNPKMITAAAAEFEGKFRVSFDPLFSSSQLVAATGARYQRRI
jgi:hypothetical protein